MTIKISRRYALIRSGALSTAFLSSMQEKSTFASWLT